MSALGPRARDPSGSGALTREQQSYASTRTSGGGTEVQRDICAGATACSRTNFGLGIQSAVGVSMEAATACTHPDLRTRHPRCRGHQRESCHGLLGLLARTLERGIRGRDPRETVPGTAAEMRCLELAQ